MNTSAFSAERSPRLTSSDEVAIPSRQSYFSGLIQSLFLIEIDTRCRPIMFVSPHPGAGVSFISSYVATELAALGGRVLLADAQGLVALTRMPVQLAVKQVERIELSRLWVLGSRQIGLPLDDERDTTSSLASIMSALRDDFPYIVIDAPALSVSDDAIKLATIVHGTVLVAQAEHTLKQEVRAACDRFTSLGGRVLGSVYNARSTGASQEPGV